MIQDPETDGQDVLVQIKDIKVDVIAKGSDPVEWYQDIKTGGHGKGDKLEFPKGPDNYNIIFTLVDETDRKIRFNASTPVFVERTLPGSPYPSTFNTDQMIVDSCSANKLVIRNWNVLEMEFRYQLNFVTAVGDPIRPFDPIIRNDGGGIRPFI